MKHLITDAKTGETIVVNLTDEEIAEAKLNSEKAIMKDLRKMRNQLLSACDWTQSPDSPVDRLAWARYRQELRDLPNNIVDILNPIWPTPPK